MMQVFMPFPSIEESVICLDDKRLTNQVNECEAILRTLSRLTPGSNPTHPAEVGWIHHPAALQWIGYDSYLVLYREVAIIEAQERGVGRGWQRFVPKSWAAPPPYIGCERYHESHRSNLYRKDPGHYAAFAEVGPDLPYVYPWKDAEFRNTEPWLPYRTAKQRKEALECHS